MLPVKILNLLGRQTSKYLVDINLFTSLVVNLEPKEKCDTRKQDGGGSGQVETVSDGIVGCISRQE